MDNRPVGIFDSGLGGLTALKVLRELLPDENIIYFGDTGRNPYGVRSAAELRCMAQQDMELLAQHGAKAIIAACGTVSSTAGDVLDAFRLPVVNVIDASVKRLAAVEGDAPLGIIATSASIESGVFKKRLSALCPGREIVDIACQDFVRLIESGHTDAADELLCAAVERLLAPMRDKGVRALLLGCTHFDFVAEAIKKYLGEEVVLVSAAGCAAEDMQNKLLSADITGTGGHTTLYTSGNAEEFAHHASHFLGESVDGRVHTAYAEKVEI